MARSPLITVTRGRFGPATGQVLEQVLAAGHLSRDEIAAQTGLSTATVGRAVTRLAELRVLRERPDRVRPGAIGRPGIPVEIDPDHFVTIGVHIGRRIATVAVGDLAGRVISHDVVRREPGAAPDLAGLSRAAARLLGRAEGRTPVTTGLVAPWRDLGLAPNELADELHELTGLEVRTADHITAIAAAEFRHRRRGVTGMTLYVYARDMFGWAVAVDKGDQTDVTRAVSLNHYPTGSPVTCECGRTGCLMATAGDEALARAAHRDGLVEEPRIEALYAAHDDPEVRALLTERARILGEVAGSVRDMVAPDRVVLVGQGFTGYPPLLAGITDAYAAASTAGEVPVSFTRLAGGAGIQAISACSVALGPILDDPLAVLSGAVPSCATPRGA